MHGRYNERYNSYNSVIIITKCLRRTLSVTQTSESTAAQNRTPHIQSREDRSQCDRAEKQDVLLESNGDKMA